MAKGKRKETQKEARPVLDRAERRENALRPSRHLGYDRDALAVYLMSREAYEIAERLLRRAIWLNPFESRFRAHLAWCLHKQGRHAVAAEFLKGVLPSEMDEEFREIAQLVGSKAARAKGVRDDPHDE